MVVINECFSKFEFILHRGSISVANLLCSVIERELSYQEYDKKGGLKHNYGLKLTDEQLEKLVPYIYSSDFKHVNQNGINFNNPKLVGYRDEISIKFRAISQDGRPLFVYEMSGVYRDWHNYPTDKLYDYLARKFFSQKKYRRTLISQGLFLSVCPC